MGWRRYLPSLHHESRRRLRLGRVGGRAVPGRGACAARACEVRACEVRACDAACGVGCPPDNARSAPGGMQLHRLCLRAYAACPATARRGRRARQRRQHRSLGRPVPRLLLRLRRLPSACKGSCPRESFLRSFRSRQSRKRCGRRRRRAAAEQAPGPGPRPPPGLWRARKGKTQMQAGKRGTPDCRFCRRPSTAGPGAGSAPGRRLPGSRDPRLVLRRRPRRIHGERRVTGARRRRKRCRPLKEGTSSTWRPRAARRPRPVPREQARRRAQRRGR